jgi:Na+-transporting methylmalonyl-CoA/oxaloacetate decarboxylase gamma subunit
MKKVILMLTLVCLAIAGVSAQTNRPAKPKKEAPSSKEAPPTKDAPSTKDVAVDKKAPAEPMYQLAYEDDAVKIFSYYAAKNKKAFVGVDKKTCEIVEINASNEISMEAPDRRVRACAEKEIINGRIRYNYDACP